MTGIVAELKAWGFDLSRAIPFEQGACVGCSRCDAVCVNGAACHEWGCPNQTYECRGCGNDTGSRQSRYCEECQ